MRILSKILSMMIAVSLCLSLIPQANALNWFGKKEEQKKLNEVAEIVLSQGVFDTLDSIIEENKLSNLSGRYNYDTNKDNKTYHLEVMDVKYGGIPFDRIYFNGMEKDGTEYKNNRPQSVSFYISKQYKNVEQIVKEAIRSLDKQFGEEHSESDKIMYWKDEKGYIRTIFLRDGLLGSGTDYVSFQFCKTGYMK